MATAKVNGVKIYYEREGRGDPLLLIGGYGCDVSWWDTIRRRLSRSFELILFDNRGCGRSLCPKKPFSIEDMADDAVGLIEHLQLNRPHILGQSMGGAIAQTVAYRNREKIGKVVLSQTFMKVRPVSAAALLHTVQLRAEGASVRAQIEAFMPWVFSDDFMKSKRKREWFIKKLMSNPHPMTLAGQKKQFQALIAFDSRKWVWKIKAPTLVLSGEEDYLCPLKEAQELAIAIRRSQFHIFPKISHNALIEDPESYCRPVSTFFLG